jgi:hypothetical protein
MAECPVHMEQSRFSFLNNQAIPPGKSGYALEEREPDRGTVLSMVSKR